VRSYNTTLAEKQCRPYHSFADTRVLAQGESRGVGSSELDLQAVAGRRNAQWLTRSRDFFVSQCLAPDLADALVVVGRFVVEQDQVFHVGELA
jgi:hypothetical protein